MGSRGNDLTTISAAHSEHAGEAFGHLASSYDEDFENLPASRRLRGLVWKAYLQHFTRGDVLLELNCGTGTDALALAQSGIRVHATDVSPGMLEAFQSKLVASPYRDLVSLQRMAFDQIPALRPSVFDGSYSNMGGLNCESDLRRVARDLHQVIRPGGVFVGTFLGHWAVWEIAAFLARGRFKEAFRRTRRSGVPARVGGSLVQTFYYSPADVAAHFAPHFTPVEVLGLNIFTPPPTSVNAYRSLGKAVRFLERVDDALMRTFPFDRLGDHFVIVLRHGESV